MELSSQNKPEELIRQNLIDRMIRELEYPSSLISVEKELKSLPHLINSKVPLRRADIICFAPNIHPKFELYPLLMIECKATPLNSKVINQVAGYNHYVKSFFIAIANDKEIRTGWFDKDKKQYTFVPYLPTYSELINSISL